MRILLLTDHYLPHRGGSRVYYHNLLLHMEEVRATVLTRRQEGDRQFDRLQPYAVTRCRLEEWGWLRPLRMQFLPIYLSLFWNGLKAIRKNRPHVIMAGELAPTGPVAALLAWIFRRPLVAFTHAEGPATLARTRWQSRLARWVCRRASLIIAASENAAEGLREHFGVPADKIEVVLPGVGEEHFDPRGAARPFEDHPDAPKGKPKKGPRLLSVGRLIARKGQLRVLQALPRVLERHPDLQYAIAGAGPMENELRRAIETNGLQATATITGEMEQEDLLRLYATSDLFVLPNADDPETGDTEGFVIVFGEASAHGLPVVGGLDGGTDASIQDGRTGLRIDGRDPQAIADAILQLLGDPARAQSLGQAGRALALANLRWPARAQRLQNILKALAGEKKRA